MMFVDGSDNFETRYLVADSSFKNKKTLVSAAITNMKDKYQLGKEQIMIILVLDVLFLINQIILKQLIVQAMVL